MQCYGMQEIIPKLGLKKWAMKKFSEGYSTMELMASAQNDYDRSVISIVALMEVDPAMRYHGMGDEEVQYLQSCHNYLRTLAKQPCVPLQLSARFRQINSC